ncbi:hypothetical protein E2C01_087060 [Portunus trituberculatus]|uniref:Uncharacterized protein n=1 Tax=Portunus trituberculatus TaxID=210409 RepID=A0A5B7J753_PORTR|nr:hypothetical protein [Portunus trituberculatus]
MVLSMLVLPSYIRELSGFGVGNIVGVGGGSSAGVGYAGGRCQVVTVTSASGGVLELRLAAMRVGGWMRGRRPCQVAIPACTDHRRSPASDTLRG